MLNWRGGDGMYLLRGTEMVATVYRVAIEKAFFSYNNPLARIGEKNAYANVYNSITKKSIYDK